MVTFTPSRMAKIPGCINLDSGTSKVLGDQPAPGWIWWSALFVIATLCFCVVAYQPAASPSYATEMLLFKPVCLMFGILFGWTWWCMGWGKTHYLCELDSGLLYWSRNDPRIIPDRGWEIVGNVVRVRNNGAIFKVLFYLTHFRPYNCVFSPANPKPFMFLTFNSSVYEATLCQGKMCYGSFSADRFLQIHDLPSFFDQHDRNEKELNVLKAGIRVIEHYLAEVPDRTKRSKPGQWVASAIEVVSLLGNVPLGSEVTPEILSVKEAIDKSTGVNLK